ncbi:MAG: GH12 family glycosyl hydrolase domain-containing protein [Myxococcota bacterium]
MLAVSGTGFSCSRGSEGNGGNDAGHDGSGGAQTGGNGASGSQAAGVAGITAGGGAAGVQSNGGIGGGGGTPSSAGGAPSGGSSSGGGAGVSTGGTAAASGGANTAGGTTGAGGSTAGGSGGTTTSAGGATAGAPGAWGCTSPEPTSPPTYGSQQCGTDGPVDLTGQYRMRNNLWNTAAASQTHCTTALWSGSGNVAGFVVNPIAVDLLSSFAPASYPSLVLGWHWGTFYGAYTQAKQISNVSSIPSRWSFTIDDSGQFDASYDLWFHPSNPKPSDPTGGLELMIWVRYRGNAVPWGTKIGTVSLNDTDWEVWYGAAGTANGLTVNWGIVSYRAVVGTSCVEMNLKPFVSDAVSRGYATNAMYFLGVQAGFEVWQMHQTMRTNSYTARIE